MSGMFEMSGMSGMSGMSRLETVLAALLLLASCGVEGLPEPVPGGVGIEGPRIRVVGAF